MRADGRKISTSNKRLFEAHREAYPDAREINFIFHAESLTSIDASQAIDVLTLGVQAVPKSTRMLYARANLLERAGRFDAAESDYRSVLELTPGDAGALNALGYALTNNTERFSEAAELLERPLRKTRATRQSSTVWDGFISN